MWVDKTKMKSNENMIVKEGKYDLVCRIHTLLGVLMETTIYWKRWLTITKSSIEGKLQGDNILVYNNDPSSTWVYLEKHLIVNLWSYETNRTLHVPH